MAKEVNISELSSAELKKILAEAEERERIERLQAKEDYETQRDNIIVDMVKRAKEVHKIMAEFKKDAFSAFENLRDQAKLYGDIRSNSKGGFGLRTKDGMLKAVLERNTKCEYDERAQIAEELIKEFLTETVKKRSLPDYNAITSLLTRNKKTGNFNPASINSLIANEDNYNDSRWKKAIKLFKESYIVTEVSMSVSFYQKDNNGKDKHINLSFPSIDI